VVSKEVVRKGFLAFRRPQEWQQLFASRRLRVVETRWLGSWLERCVHHPLLVVLEKSCPSRARSAPGDP
jgi:hypothetical protein